MDVSTFENMNKPVEAYHRVNVSQFTFSDTEIDISGVGKFSITDDLFIALCRFVGIPKGLNQELRKIDKSLWEQVVRKLYQTHYESELVIKVQDDVLVGISNYEKDPVGNVKFIARAISQFDDFFDVDVEEILYNPSNQHSSVIVLATPVYDFHGEDYKLGAVMENDSLYGVTVRLVVKNLNDSTYVYGTPKVLNISSARYNRTSETGLDAYSNMLITLSDIIRGDVFKNEISKRVEEALYQERSVKVTYEEYYRARIAIVRNCTLSGFDEDTVKKFTEDFRDLFDFFKNYPSVMEADSIWRTTAYSDKDIVTVRKFISELSNNISLTYEACRDLRSLSGEYLFGNPLYRSIALRK